MKQQLIDDICLKLDELRIPFTLKDGTYINVNTEFYDIGYGIEPKIVLYDLSVFLDEAHMAVFLYAKTVDKPAPTAEGAHAEAAQVSTIFRKVRHVCYDEDGKITVIPIDLGDVPNTVKDTAFKYGWKFRTAQNLNKPKKDTAIPQSSPPIAREPEAAQPVALSEPEIIAPTELVKKAGNDRIGTRLRKFFHR
jgi:hypothetical protein